MNYKKHQLRIFLFLLILIHFSCRNDRSKKRHRATVAVCNNSLFIESYTIWRGGAFGGDIESDYLTDSTDFRIFIGTYNDANENIAYICNGDTIFVYNQKMDEGTNRFKIVNTRFFRSSQLKKEKLTE